MSEYNDIYDIYDSDEEIQKRSIELSDTNGDLTPRERSLAYSLLDVASNEGLAGIHTTHIRRCINLLICRKDIAFEARNKYMVTNLNYLLSDLELHQAELTLAWRPSTWVKKHISSVQFFSPEYWKNVAKVYSHVEEASADDDLVVELIRDMCRTILVHPYSVKYIDKFIESVAATHLILKNNLVM